MAMRKDTYYRNLSLTNEQSELVICDGDNLYFRLRKGKKGISKSWMFIYKSKGTNKQVRLSLGKYPTLTLAEARKQAIDLRQNVSEGKDPREKRTIAKIMTGNNSDHFDLDQTIQSLTFGEVAELFFKQMLHREQLAIAHELEQAEIRAKHENHQLSALEVDDIKTKRRASKDARLRLDKYLLPQLGKLSIQKLSKPVVVKALEPLEAQGIQETIKRCCTLVNQIGEFAENRGYIEFNRFSNLTKAFVKPRPTAQKTITPDQLNQVISAMGKTNMKSITRAAFELQLHLLSRSSEIAKLRWDEYNAKEAVIKIGGYRMKGMQTHTIPLSPYAKGLLEHIRQFSGRGEYIFPSDKTNGKRPYLNPQSVNAVMKRAGLGKTIVAHGLRAVGSTALNDALKYGSKCKFDKDQIEVCLAHMDKDGIRQIYNNAEYIEERREMLTWWSNFIIEQTGDSYSLAKQCYRA